MMTQHARADAGNKLLEFVILVATFLLSLLFYSPPLALALNEVLMCDFDSGEKFSSFIDGVKGKAAWFDGKSYFKPFDEKIKVPETFTFQVWVKPEAYLGGYQGNFSFVGRLLLNSNGMLKFQVGPQTLESAYRLDFYAWSLISGTYDGTTMRLYVNGELHASEALLVGRIESDLYLGKAQYFYLGAIDEVTLHDGVMSSSEIKDYYKTSTANIAKGRDKVLNLTIRNLHTIEGKVNFQKTFSLNMDKSDSFRPFLYKNVEPVISLKKNADNYFEKYNSAKLDDHGIARACVAIAKYGVIGGNDSYAEVAISMLMDRVAKGTGSAGDCHTDHYRGNFGFYKYLEAYDYLCKSSAFTLDKRLACEEFFRESIRKASAHWASHSSTNHGFVETTAGILVGVCLKEPGLTGWGLARLMGHLQGGVLCDGSWYQNSMLIHNMVVWMVGLISEPLRNIGIGLEDIVVPAATKTARDISGCEEKSFLLMKEPYIKLATPDRKLPCMGYYARSRTDLDPVNYIKNLINLVKPFDAFINREKIYEQIDLQQSTSSILPDSGFVVLRKGKDETRKWAMLSYGYHYDVVHHLDNLNLTLWAYGRFITPDFPRIVSDTGGSFYQGYVRQAWSHNCVVVDGKGHSTKRGILDYQGSRNGLEIVNVMADETYEGVSWRRILALSDDYIVCIDKLLSDNKHTYDSFFHFFDAKAQIHVAEEQIKDKSISLSEYPYYSDVSSYDHGEKFSFLMGDEICKMRFIALNADNTKIFIGNIPTKFNNDGKLIENVANLVLRKQGKKALFINVIETFKTDSVLSNVTFEHNKYLNIKYKNGHYDTIEILENDIRIISGLSLTPPKDIRKRSE